MYRFFEIIPGALAWLTLVGMVLLSSRLPVWVAVFIILFDIYWLLKTVYLSFHLRNTFSSMRKNMQINWLEKLEQLQLTTDKKQLTDGQMSVVSGQMSNVKCQWSDVYHLVILPVYREPYAVVRESFASIAATNYPKEKMIVVLASEERGGDEAKAVAEKIQKEFDGPFFKFLVTVHPENLAGEIPGKGSNETWGALEAKKMIIDPLINTQTYADDMRTNAEKNQRKPALRYDNILVSVFDADTQVFPEYFGRLTHAFLTEKNNARAIYQPVPLFTNNIYKAPALARVVSFSATFWQMMQQSRPERLTSFSSQSLPFQVLLDIGFWQRNIVSEDSRVFWQGYFCYHGDFRVVPLLYPVSMDANVATTLWQTMKNIYKQQRRWGWGCENIPYLLDGFRKDRLIPARKKWYWSFNVIEGFHSWATNSLMIFALGWLPVLLGGNHFNDTLLSYGLPKITRFIITLSMVGIASSAILGIFLLPPRPQWFRTRHYAAYLLQWILIPVTLIVFGAIPGLEAQTRLMLGGKFRLGFWVTPKMRAAASRGGNKRQ